MSDWRPPSKHQPFAPQFPAASFSPPAVPPHVRSTSSLGNAVIWLFAVDLLTLAAAIVTAYHARQVCQQLVSSGFDPAVVARLRTTDNVHNALAVASPAPAVAGTVVLAIWSYRVATNAKARGVLDVSPRLAAGGWFIPFANAVVPFVQLRRAVRPFLRHTTSITAWQILVAAGILIQRTGRNDFDKASTADQRVAAYSTLITRESFATMAVAIGWIVAAREIKRIDRYVSAIVRGVSR